MDNNLTTAKLLAQFKQSMAVWEQCPGLSIKGTSRDDYSRIATTLRATLDELADLKSKIRSRMSVRDDLAEKLNEVNLRIRSGVHGYFGPDSIEYEQVGCMRQSKRRKPGPKPRRQLPRKRAN